MFSILVIASLISTMCISKFEYKFLSSLTPLVQYISLKYVMTDQTNLYLGN